MLRGAATEHRDMRVNSERASWRPLTIDTGEGAGRLDEAGVRWPQVVELRGDAKEFWEATREYQERNMVHTCGRD